MPEPGSPEQRVPADQQASKPGDDAAAIFSPPQISLPKGGGAIRGMGEKFQANPVTGTASLSVPLPLSPGRGGFTPQLALSYDSGAGNGPFGWGWSLGLPSITRKTDKGLPRYDDAAESDVFILSGAEDLVPVLVKNAQGAWEPELVPDRTVDDVVYQIARYRPRIEGLFARIERWVRKDNLETHWRSISRDNITTPYGATPESRIADPTDANRIFSWLICQSFDDRGNAAIYSYRHEDDIRITQPDVDEPPTWAHEQNREPDSSDPRSANCYLTRIRYGNRAPNRTESWTPTNPAELGDDTWMLDVLFDYGNDHYTEETDEGRTFGSIQVENPAHAWYTRLDPFSTYRAGFEVRTYRLCRRVLMVHHFEDALGTPDYLVRSMEFTYSETPIATILANVTSSGFLREEAGGRFLKKSWPSLDFQYSAMPGPDAIAAAPLREVDPDSLENLPAGVDGTTYQWADLDGEGSSGILTEQADGWFYKRNLSANNIPLDETGNPTRITPRFGPVERVASKPNVQLRAGNASLLDLAGDGHLDIVMMAGPVKGFYERTETDSWASFQPFAASPTIDTADPNLKFVDLDGDGLTDILVTEHEALTWYRSLGETGFSAATRTSLPRDEERGPQLVFADGTNSLFLADMSGDGLSDLVRIRNGEVCYWPSLGYGRFGSRVTMDNAPWFDYSDLFEPRRIRLADIDGSGVTDIVYLGRNATRVYLNQAGNRWSDGIELLELPPVDDVATVQIVDLLGVGTMCVVWSSSLPADAGRQLRYLDLMDGVKPHLLVSVANNLGAETVVEYAPSTRYYLEDKARGRPWVSRLPFPVHVIARVETYDWVSRNRFVSRYTYHHGYFDGEEREFRGFGRVDQIDTEELGTFRNGAFPEGENVDETTMVPPVETRTWFHTGLYLGREQVEAQLAGALPDRSDGEYYWEAKQRLLDDTRPLPPGLTPEEERQAVRALKGLMLRQEVFAQDGSPDERHPYSVLEQCHNVEILQPMAGNRHAVFFSHPAETITYHYERRHDPHDPRVAHALTLEVDDYGNLLKSAAIGYGRRQEQIAFEEPEDRKSQANPLLTYTEQVMTNAVVDLADDYRTPLPWETRIYELTGFDEIPSDGYAAPEDLVAETGETTPGNRYALTIDDDDGDLSYEKLPTSGKKQRRLIEHVRTAYQSDALDGLLSPRELESMALPGQLYRLAFTPGLLSTIYQRPLSNVSDPETPVALIDDIATILPVGSAGEGADRGGYLSSQTLRAAGVFPTDESAAEWTTSDENDHWWAPTGRIFYTDDSALPEAAQLPEARQRFFTPRRFEDPFGQRVLLSHDDDILLPVETLDPVDNRITIENDYRTLQPKRIVDPNGNRQEAAFDALGLVVGTAVSGRSDGGPTHGDSLTGFVPDLTLDETTALLDLENPRPVARLLLKDATTRLVYDLERFQRTRTEAPDDREAWQPAFVSTIRREMHASDPEPPGGLAVQIDFSHSDGFGRVIQKKIPAEPGPVDGGGAVVDPRWVGSGWTVFNNKGKPVRQFEAFFSDRQRFQFGAVNGVSSILFYDPPGRVVATLHPNNTWEKVIFDPWRQVSFDVNDTVAAHDDGTGVPQTGDPATDPDIKDYVAAYFAALPESDSWKTWYQQRITGAMGSAEQTAAEKAAKHANTPTTAHFDALGRAFLTVAHNRFERTLPGGTIETVDEDYASRVELDIEGNQLRVRDADTQTDPRGRLVAIYRYDVHGTRIHQASMEAGERWMLNDVLGNTIRGWNSRKFEFRTEYDPARRHIRSLLVDPENPGAAPLLVERRVYGEQRPEAEKSNLRGRLYLHADQAGAVAFESYDFHGNVLISTRRLAKEYKETLDWTPLDSALPADAGSEFVAGALDPALTLLLEETAFTSRSLYDALDRVVQTIAPRDEAAGGRRNVVQPTYNEASLLDRLDVWLDYGAEPAGLIDRQVTQSSPAGVENIDYNAKGQRIRIDYQNGTSTWYMYEPETFRLRRLYTRRGTSFDDCDVNVLLDPWSVFPPPNVACGVQNLHYTYDPIGNITDICDDAQQTVFFRNRIVRPVSTYSYDATYRLVFATGREHLGQAGNPPTPYSYNDLPRVGLLHPGDEQAMGNYTEEYRYDEVGNFTQMSHQSTTNGVPGWTRTYAYAEPSQLETGAISNRLTSTEIGGDVATYSYDEHGNMLQMPQLAELRWDFADRLSMTKRQRVNAGDTDGNDRHGERTWYVYDAAGQRVQKAAEKSTGSLKDHRLYLGGFEIFQSTGPNALTRESLHVMDGQQRVALIETRTEGTDASPEVLIRFQYGNHLGSVSLELDETADLVSYEEYTPYGSSAYQTLRDTGQSLKRYRFSGKERDEETGLNYHGARYYAPWLARWTTCDPAGLGDGSNLYSYCVNNPVNRSDGQGTESEWCVFCNPFSDDVTFEPGKFAKEEVAPRAIGALKVVGGTAEAVVGAGVVATGVATSEVGVGVPIAVGGVLITAHGADTASAGLAQLWTGKETDTLFSQGLQEYGGLSRSEANTVDAVVGIAGTAGGGLIAKTGSAVTITEDVVTHTDDALNVADDLLSHADEVVTHADEGLSSVAGASDELSSAAREGETFTDLAEAEISSAVDNAAPVSGTPAQLPGQNPRTGEGLVNQVTRADRTKDIQYQEKLTFKGIKDAPGKKVEFRRHSANPNAPEGTYSRSNPTTQVNSVKPKEYMLPDGSFKPLNSMTEAEIEAAHFP